MSKVSISGNASGTGVFTIQAPSSNTDRVLSLPDEAGTVLTTASNITAQAMNGPAFFAFQSTAQSISANTSTKIALNQETFDTNSCFDTGTYRFTPNVAGYYQINATITFNGSTALYSVLTILKNGNLVLETNNQKSNGNFNGLSAAVVVYLNGSTDYIELFGYEQNASTTVIAGTQLSGALVRAA